MQTFKLNYIACGAIALALGNSLIACSDEDEGSKINVGAGSGGSTSGGASNSGGSTSAGTTGSGGSNSGGKGGAVNNAGTGNVPACPGIVLDQAPGAGGDNGLGGAGGDDSGTGGTATAGTGAAGTGGTGGTACAGQSLEVESIDVDMYIMMDRSVSMATLVEGTNMTRWEALTAAMQAFVEHPDAADIGAGIGFFGKSGHSDAAQDCNVDNYATPDVPVGLIADVGPDLVDAMEAQTPSGLTPTYPAVQGAVQYSLENAQDRPGRAPLVVLVSDGYPTQCQEPVDVSEIANVAEAAFLGSPSVRTYVVGLVAGFNLQSIAVKGGTNLPFLVDEGDITTSFVQTMLNITDTKLACNYDIPDPPTMNEQIDLDKISVIYDPPSGPSEEVPKVNNLADCASVDNGGWFFDDPSDPTRIMVCPCTCARFQAGAVDIRYGCEPFIGIM